MLVKQYLTVHYSHPIHLSCFTGSEAMAEKWCLTNAAFLPRPQDVSNREVFKRMWLVNTQLQAV